MRAVRDCEFWGWGLVLLGGLGGAFVASNVGTRVEQPLASRPDERSCTDGKETRLAPPAAQDQRWWWELRHPGEPIDDVAQQLAEQTAIVLPQKWEVWAAGHVAIVTRKTVLHSDNSNVGSWEQWRPSTRMVFQLRLDVGAPMSPPAFQRLSMQQNVFAQRRRELEVRMESLEGAGMDHAYKEDYYEPKTSADHAMVNELLWLKSQLQPVPIGYVGAERTVFLSDNAPTTMGEGDMVCDDCKAVEAKIRALITPYPSADLEARVRRRVR